MMSDKNSSITYLSSSAAAELDRELMSRDVGYSIDQLMELAGLAVAQCIQTVYDKQPTRLLVMCGPGNNGGDGLVAARHLSQFGYRHVQVVYPKLSYLKEGSPSTPLTLYQRLVRQLVHHEVPVVSTLEETLSSKDSTKTDSLACALSQSFDVVVDSMFGFGFTGDVRQPYADMIQTINKSKLPVVSVDLPSGWDVDKGPLESRVCISNPTVVISLTAPKMCMRPEFLPPGLSHFLGGRFVPRSLIKKFQLILPQFNVLLNDVIVPSGPAGNPMHVSRLPLLADEGPHWILPHSHRRVQRAAAVAPEPRHLEGVFNMLVNQMRPQVDQSRGAILRADEKAAVQNVVSTVAGAAGNIGSAVLGTFRNNNNRDERGLHNNKDESGLLHIFDQSYEPRQPTSRGAILRTDERAAGHQSDSLVQNVVSTVAGAAGNIGSAVLGTKRNNNNKDESGLLHIFDQSYEPRQPTSRGPILRTDERAAGHQSGDTLVQNVVSTVADAAGNIGTAVLGTKRNNNNKDEGGLLNIGGVVNRVMHTVGLDSRNHDQNDQGGLAQKAVNLIRSNRPNGVLGRITGSDRTGKLFD